MDMEEYKLLNGWSYDKKRGSTRYDRVPVGIRRIVKFDRIEDYMTVMFQRIEGRFYGERLCHSGWCQC